MKKNLMKVLALTLALLLLAGSFALADRPVEEIEGFWTNIAERLTLDICDRNFELLGPGGMCILEGKILFCIRVQESGSDGSYRLTVMSDKGLVTVEVDIVRERAVSDTEDGETPVYDWKDLWMVLNFTIKGDTYTYTLFAPGTEPALEYPEIVCYKPVIYLYPETETEVSVSLSLTGGITCSYPAYGDGWTVTAEPGGMLTDGQDRRYDYLYWEGTTAFDTDMSRGWCVKGTDTAQFLEGVLPQLGLNDSETNAFIVYWLPLMQENAYNLISFDAAAYCDSAVLTVSPEPDTIIRVFMTYAPSEDFAQITAPELPDTPARNGFTLVEWGGTVK